MEVTFASWDFDLTYNGTDEAVNDATGTATGEDFSESVTGSVEILPAPSLGQEISGLTAPTGTLQVGEGTKKAETEEGGTKTWSSSNTEIATIASDTGIVTPVKAGNVTISYASDNGKVNSIEVTVHEAAAEKPPKIGEVRVDAGNVTPTDFTAATTGESIVWLSSDSDKATVEQTTGEITPVTAGKTTISYRVTNEESGLVVAKGELEITVLDAG